MNTIAKLPDATRNRLVQLLTLLRAWPEAKIKSTDIAASTGWKTSLIRHDLWVAGFDKGVSNGYQRDQLISYLEDFLKLQPKHNDENNELKPENCCIVGLGRLGAALLDNSLLENSPFTIKAGFDSNLNRVEILRSTFPLYPANEMQFVIKRDKIEYAILTVQNKDAQQMCSRLVSAGIKGIINMTATVLQVPQNVKVENLSIVNALINCHSKIKEQSD